MRVSIITPSFNQGAFIQRTIDSVLSQDYADLELIIMDGGSTDDTLAVLNAITDPRVRWLSQRDNGQSDAINRGLQMATGDILTYLNSDDVLLPGAVAKSVAALTGEGAPDLVYGDVIVIDAGDQPIGQITAAPFDLRRALISDQPIGQPGTFWTRRLMERVGLFDETLHYTMDYDYWLRAARAGFALCYVPGAVAGFRWHDSSKSVSQQPRFLSDWEQMAAKLYADPTLPDELRAMQPVTQSFIDWGWTKTYWLQGDYALARPRLKHEALHGKSMRRPIALAMWIDSYLHTPFTRWLSWSFWKVTGREILFGKRRAI